MSVKNILAESYSKSWDFLKESRIFVYFSVILFFVFVAVGFFVPAPEFISQSIFEFIEELLKETSNLGHLELILYIFLNNIQSSFIGMVFGIFLGVPSISSLMVNGYLVGFVSSLVTGTDGLSSLWRLLPHGIFELPAIFISLGLGLKIGSFVFEKKKIDSLKKYLKNSLLTFVLIVLPLLVIAAIIEGSLIYFVN